MNRSNFFYQEASVRSKVKTGIVVDYFLAWAKIMKNRASKIGYLDLFCGKGFFDDGTKSTPIRIMEAILEDELLKRKVIVVFNDENKAFTDSLKQRIYQLPGINSLSYEPIITNSSVDLELAKQFDITLIPCFTFIDPWGYKGVTKRLITNLTKDWGSDSLFFFNINRINPGLNNLKVEEHIKLFFGNETYQDIKDTISQNSDIDREELIMDKLSQSLQDTINYVLPFQFLNENGERTSHYLVFITKNLIAYKIMKDIMHKYSSERHEGIASFSYIPIKNKQLSILPLYTKTLNELEEELLNQFRGKSLTVKEIIDSHHVNTPFVEKNYKQVLKKLESEGKISANPPQHERKSNTMANHVIIYIPN